MIDTPLDHWARARANGKTSYDNNTNGTISCDEKQFGIKQFKTRTLLVLPPPATPSPTTTSAHSTTVSFRAKIEARKRSTSVGHDTTPTSPKNAGVLFLEEVPLSFMSYSGMFSAIRQDVLGLFAIEGKVKHRHSGLRCDEYLSRSPHLRHR